MARRAFPESTESPCPYQACLPRGLSLTHTLSCRCKECVELCNRSKDLRWCFIEKRNSRCCQPSRVFAKITPRCLQQWNLGFHKNSASPNPRSPAALNSGFSGSLTAFQGHSNFRPKPMHLPPTTLFPVCA